jgi:hypothetical protein
MICGMPSIGIGGQIIGMVKEKIKMESPSISLQE